MLVLASKGVAMAESGWKADPSGEYEVRYWDGSRWTEHVSRDGIQSTDSGGEWPPPGTSTAEEVPAKQWAPDSLWEGERKSLTAAATGGRVITGRYRITREYIYFDAGLVSTKSEQVPLWAVRDVDVKQSLTQKARKVGDVVVRVQHDDYTGRYEVVLESIEEPRAVRDLINSHAQPARLEHQRRAQTHVYQGGVPAGQPILQSSPSEAPTPGPVGGSVVTQLKELAELRDQGILTDEEFQSEKTKILGN